MEEPRIQRARALRLRRPVMGLVAGLALLGLMEVGATIAERARSTPAATSIPLPGDIFRADPRVGWRTRPGFAGRSGDGRFREFDAEGHLTLDTAQIADGATPKVLFIGDSNTFGYGVDSGESFVEVADWLTPGVSAINLGVPGYSSTQGLVVAREVIEKMRPAAVVVSFNFNDRRFAPMGPDGPERFETIFRQSDAFLLNRLSHALEWSATFRLIRRAEQVLGLVPAPMPVGQFDLSEAAPRVDEDTYRRNLTEIVAIARSVGARPLLVQLRDGPYSSTRINRSAAQVAAGDLTSAIPVLQVLDEEHYTIARLYLADAYRQLGDDVRSKEALRLVPDDPNDVGEDGLGPIRLDTAYNEIMAAVGKATGVEVIDAASVLESMKNVFIDDCHFNAEGHEAVGRLLAAWLHDQSFHAG